MGHLFATLLLAAASPGPASYSALRAAFEAVKYEAVIAQSQSIDVASLTVADRVSLYFMVATAHAARDSPSDAVTALQLLLRLQPGFEAPGGASPKLTTALASARDLNAREDGVARERLGAQIAISGAVSARPARGGRPIGFVYTLLDPAGAVSSMRVHYRMQSDREFAVLPLREDADGRWFAWLAGAATASDEAFSLQYVVEARDARGLLKALGSFEAPLTLPLAPGHARSLLPRRVFGAVTTVAVALGAATGGLAIARESLQQEYYRVQLAPGGATTEQLARIAERGSAVSNTLIAGGVSCALSGVAALIIFFFTDFDPEPVLPALP